MLELYLGCVSLETQWSGEEGKSATSHSVRFMAYSCRCLEQSRAYHKQARRHSKSEKAVEASSAMSEQQAATAHKVLANGHCPQLGLDLVSRQRQAWRMSHDDKNLQFTIRVTFGTPFTQHPQHLWPSTSKERNKLHMRWS